MISFSCLDFLKKFTPIQNTFDVFFQDNTQLALPRDISDWLVDRNAMVAVNTKFTDDSCSSFTFRGSEISFLNLKSIVGTYSIDFKFKDEDDEMMFRITFL